MSNQEDISLKIKNLTDDALKGTVTKEQAIQGISPDELNIFSAPVAALQGNETVIAANLQKTISGVAHGIAAFNTDEAKKLISAGKPAILIINSTSAEDTKIMKQCKAVVSLTGGSTSHAAIICRGEGIPCIAGDGKLSIDSSSSNLLDKSGNILVSKGDTISIDGNSGTIYKGIIPQYNKLPPPELETLLKWADKASHLKTYVILDSIQGLDKAINEGVKGVSILRTEHMFFEGERTHVLQQLILEPIENSSQRKELLSKLEQFQKDDFNKIFNKAATAPEQFPINIRLLDPPMHEFLPKEKNWESFIKKTAGKITQEDLKNRHEALHESNPMMGLRGVRLLLQQPDIMRMQLKAVFEAAADSEAHTKKPAIFSICLPMVENAQQVKDCKKIMEDVRKEVIAAHKLPASALQYKTSVMIETPAAVINSDKISQEVNNFSLGTHDLAAATHFTDRDSCLNPEIFVSLSPETKFMINHAAKQGKSSNKSLTIGICGDQGKDLESIKTISAEIPEITYITANPQDILKTRLSAGQAGIYASQFRAKIKKPSSEIYIDR